MFHDGSFVFVDDAFIACYENDQRLRWVVDIFLYLIQKISDSPTVLNLIFPQKLLVYLLNILDPTLSKATHKKHISSNFSRVICYVNICSPPNDCIDVRVKEQQGRKKEIESIWLPACRRTVVDTVKRGS